jgi:hypothetical protein
MTIQEHLSDIPTLFKCASEQGPEHFTRITTPFHLPDGCVLDLYYKEGKNETFHLTDLGETLRWLKDQWVEQSPSAPMLNLLPGICLTHGVELAAGCLTIRGSQTSMITKSLFQIAQAALQIADLLLIQDMQLSLNSPDKTGVEEEDLLPGQQTDLNTLPLVSGPKKTLGRYSE